MEDTYTKIDETTMQVEKAPEPIVQTFDISFLKSQREQILNDQARVALELAEIDNLLAQAEKLKIVDNSPEFSGAVDA